MKRPPVAVGMIVLLILAFGWLLGTVMETVQYWKIQNEKTRDWTEVVATTVKTDMMRHIHYSISKKSGKELIAVLEGQFPFTVGRVYILGDAHTPTELCTFRVWGKECRPASAEEVEKILPLLDEGRKKVGVWK